MEIECLVLMEIRMIQTSSAVVTITSLSGKQYRQLLNFVDASRNFRTLIGRASGG